MEMYNRAMADEFDRHPASNTGMDQGRHIALVLLDLLVGAPNITSVIKIPMGSGEVHTLGVPLKKHGNQPLNAFRYWDSSRGLMLNADGAPTPVVHMFDRHKELKAIIANRTQQAMVEWNQTRDGISDGSSNNAPWTGARTSSGWLRYFHVVQFDNSWSLGEG